MQKIKQETIAFICLLWEGVHRVPSDDISILQLCYCQNIWFIIDIGMEIGLWVHNIVLE